jgi:hypothetical protein
MLTSQLPVARWHEQIGEPTAADGILDRLVHNAHRIEVRSDSMRKTRIEGNQIPSCLARATLKTQKPREHSLYMIRGRQLAMSDLVESCGTARSTRCLPGVPHRAFARRL